jgi:hypothetical protein
MLQYSISLFSTGVPLMAIFTGEFFEVSFAPCAMKYGSRKGWSKFFSPRSSCFWTARPAVAPYQFMKRYLITGASRGIGCAIAEKLAAPDVALLLHGRDTVALAEVCESVNPRCGRVVRDVASAVAYALSRRADVALENISLSNLTGNL